MRDQNISALALHIGDAQRNQVFFLRHLARSPYRSVFSMNITGSLSRIDDFINPLAS